jgi:alkanesulfonate monooxygenase SsuD/methylene tetrahydromethanopterin reductase-like flavin-dependent oxidoreductase (luciferase family)
VNAPVPNAEEARTYPYTEADRRRIAHHRRRVVLGEPAAVRDRLLELQERFQADELMAITITGDYGSRLESYELLAATFGLSGACQRKVG